MSIWIQGNLNVLKPENHYVSVQLNLVDLTAMEISLISLRQVSLTGQDE